MKRHTIQVQMNDELDLRSAAGRSGLSVAEVVHVLVVLVRGGLRAFPIPPGPASSASPVHGEQEVEVGEEDAAFFSSLSGGTGVPVRDLVSLAMSRGGRQSLLGLGRLQPALWSSLQGPLVALREAEKGKAGKGKPKS